MGYEGGDFKDALTQACSVLLGTPVVPGDVAVRAEGDLFMYADPRLEAMSAAQKQLFRMGPANVRRIQVKLRAFARALDIPAERPAP